MIFTTLLLSALATLPLATAHSPLAPQFVNIPAHRRDSHHHSFARRALPRSGRRMNARAAGQATVRCDSEYTWSLCDGDACTAMGGVAAGTACIDGAITWADTGKVAGDDAGGAAITEAWGQALEPSTPPPKSSSTPAPKPTATKEVLSTFTKPVKPTSTASEEEEEAAPEQTSSSPVVLAVVATSSPSPSSSYTPPAPSSTPVVEELIEPSSSSTPPPAPTSTSSSSASPPAATPPTSGGNSFRGTGSFYTQEGAYGACGRVSQDSEHVVALAMARYGTHTNPNNAPDCGRQVSITNVANGKTTTATVQDACPGCRSYDSLDLSTSAFGAIADFDKGIVEIEWRFIS